MCTHAPACVFDHRFDAPLRYAWSNCTHSGHYRSDSRLRSRAQSAAPSNSQLPEGPRFVPPTLWLQRRAIFAE